VQLVIDAVFWQNYYLSTINECLLKLSHTFCFASDILFPFFYLKEFILIVKRQTILLLFFQGIYIHRKFIILSCTKKIIFILQSHYI